MTLYVFLSLSPVRPRTVAPGALVAVAVTQAGEGLQSLPENLNFYNQSRR
jgi:hypothetical protein